MRILPPPPPSPVHAVEPLDMFWLTATLPEEYYWPLPEVDEQSDASIGVVIGGVVFATLLLMALIVYGLLVFW
jgi:hypothetical protein